MKKTFLTLCMCAALCASAATAPVDYVSTLVGTQSKYELSNGNTVPLVQMPWGMNGWIPQTGKNGDGWSYTYNADKIVGFKQTHRPSPWINDYGQFSLMPVVGTPVFGEQQRASWFSHKAEVATPYYYKVYLADWDVTTEFAATERAAAFCFTFPQAELSTVVIDAFDDGSSVTVDPANRRITGYTTKNSGGVPDNFKNYFVIEFDTHFTYTASVLDSVINTASLSATGNHAGAIVGFATRKGQKVNARVASSFISLEQAMQNLTELGSSGDIKSVSAAGRDRWNKVLGAIEIEADPSDPFQLDRLRTFYSNLYHALLFPHAFYELTDAGNVVHYSPYSGEVCPGYMFTDTGFWDTFRALFPLVNLLYPSESTKIQDGLVNAYIESGFLPEWASPGHRGCMVGNNSASIVADAYLNGIRGYDYEKLWEAVTSGAHKVHPTVSSTGRLGFEYYDRLGYVPYNVGINESAARTLEYAYDDWCIYQFGKALGKSAKELAPYAKAALNYRNLFDNEHNLMRGRNEDGSFQTPFNPLKWGDAFTEGNSWHYTWSVFHDPQGLIDLMGGDDTFNSMLDSVFNLPPVFDDSYYGFPIHEIREMQIMGMGNYAHGNQPIQHMIYLYNYSGEPWKTQYWAREVMNRMYTPNPDGYCGDEDNGQTSAWYVFSALGFYPVAPGTGEFILGAPLFRKAVVKLENGNSVTIEAPANSDTNRYVDALTLDGQPYDKTYVTYRQLTSGATLDYTMSDTPNTARATSKESRPYSFSTSPDMPKIKAGKSKKK